MVIAHPSAKSLRILDSLKPVLWQWIPVKYGHGSPANPNPPSSKTSFSVRALQPYCIFPSAKMISIGQMHRCLWCLRYFSIGLAGKYSSM